MPGSTPWGSDARPAPAVEAAAPARIVYSDGNAWTGAHDAWLRRQRFELGGVQGTFESDYDAVLSVKARRDRLDTAISTWLPTAR